MVRSVDIRGLPHAYSLTSETAVPTVLVFVHGWLLSHAYWQPVIQRLSADYPCLSYDLRGFGQSQPVDDYKIYPQTLEQRSEAIAVGASCSRPLSEVTTSRSEYAHTPAAYAEDLLQLLQTLNIENAWLVGHSLGGSIALWAAHQSPSAIAGVVCVNSGGGIYLKEEFERFRMAGTQLVKLRPRWLPQVPLLDVPFARMNVAQPISRQWARQRLMDWVAAHPTAALGALLDSTTEAEVHDLPRLVAGLSQPVYFLAGDQDDVMEPKYVNHLASFHSLFECCGHNVLQLPNCGHLSMLEHPDAVAQYIRQILTVHA
ncbi:MAG: alpha/beta hydrolase [Leptolyngbya sp. DLM2.Bin15]|nr:MAG: alpha/beta hydrolase [Leptolyngbya sp. DLM2.Bin15]